MSTVASGLSFEVLRFAAAPVSAEVVLLELEGRFRADPRRRLGVPRLVVERSDRTREIAPAAAGEALAEPDGTAWRASFAVALELLEDGEFSLAVGRELLLGLPAPDLGDGSDDREVRLAREANALRRTADEARAAAAAALASAGTERQAREAAETEMAEARMARDDHARRAASLDESLAQLRREHAAELVRRDEQHEAALAGRDAEAAQAAEERSLALEAEVAEARRALRNARADAEAMQRELERERERAEAAEAALPRGRVTELDGEPVEGDPLDDRPTTRIEGDGASGEADDGEPTTRMEGEPAGDAPTTRLDADNGEPHDGEPTARLDSDSDAGDGEPHDGATTTRVDTDAGEALAAEAAEPRHEDVTEVAMLQQIEPPEALEPPAPGAAAGESVRVIGARRPRRTGEGKPAEPAPGTGAIGARYIEPAQTQRSAVEAWITRVLAFAALVVVVVALLLVLKPF